MKDRLNAPSARQTKNAVTVKFPYSQPDLKVFGRVQELTQGNNGTNIDMDNTATKQGLGSDRALKENIVRIGDHPLGIGLYLFDYKPEYRQKWGHRRQFGVMAQEVETVLPEAVHLHADGYKMVNYAMLGISHRIQ